MRVSSWGRWGLVTLGLTSVMGLGACTPERESDGEGGGVEVTQESIVLDVEANLDASLGGLARALQFLNESQFIDLLPSGEAEECYSDEFGEYCESFEDDEAAGLDLESGVEGLAGFLREEILSDANIEEQTASAIIYRIPADTLCGGMTGSLLDPTLPEDGLGEVDRDNTLDDDADTCRRVFTEEPIRVRASSPRAHSVKLELLVGQARVNPLSAELTPSSSSLTMDLAEGKRALQALAQAADEPIDLPEVMRGSVQVKVAGSGAAFTGSVSILEPVEIVSMSLESPLMVRLDRASPAMELGVDGQGRTLSVQVDMGSVDVMGDLGMFGSSTTSSGDCFEDFETGEIFCDDVEEEGVTSSLAGHTLLLHLGGASFQATYTGAEDRMVLTNLGLGSDQTHLDVDGQTVFGMDLNATRGRRFDLTVESGADGMEVAISPAFELAMALDMRHMPDAAEGAYPAWALDEDMKVTLDGSSPRLLLDEESGALRVLSGSLRLESSSLGSTVVANTNQCIWGSGAAEDEEWSEDGVSEEGSAHPFEGLQSGVCPSP